MNGDDTFNKHQWTGQWTYQKNGVTVSENFTERNDNWEELIKYRKAILNQVPSTKSFPDDEGEVASQANVEQADDFCPIHKVRMKLRTGKTGTWYSHSIKQDDGSYEWCNGR